MLKNYKDLKYEFHDNLTELPSNPESTAVLCLGKEPLLALAEHKLIPKNRTVTGLRLQPIALPGMTAKAIVSYNPGIADIDYGKYVDLQTDAGAAMRMSVTGSLDPKYGNYEYVDNFKQYRAYVEAMYAATGKPVESALDLETLGLDPYLKPALQHPGAYVVSIQLTHTVGTAQVVYFPSPKSEREWFANKEFWDDLNWILTTPKISTRGANLKYDLHWLHKRAGIYCTNFKFDTTLVGSLLDENRSNGLDVHCKIYAPALGGYSDVFDRTIDKARMDLVPKATLLPYAGGDSDATLRVSIAQKAQLVQDPRLAAFYVNIMHPASRAFELIEQGGMLVDKQAYTELAADLNTEINSLVVKARSILGGRIWAKHSDPTKPGGLNLTKASMLQDYMFSPMGLNLKPRAWTDGSYDAAGNLKPDPTPSTALDNLLLFGDVPEAKAFVDLLADYSSAVKTKGTYVDGFLKHLRSDGRYHPSYYFFAGNKDEGDGGTNCMPAGELVLTNRGYLPVERVRIGDYVLSHMGVPRKVTNTVDNGTKPVVRVTLSNGLSLRTTPNHAYLVGNSWVEAGFISPGMQVWAHSGAEEWETILGWEDFKVSSWGRVLNTTTGRILAQLPKGKWGHLKVCLYRNGEQKRGKDRKDFTVHQLVANAFNEVLGGTEVRHLNGIAWDNTNGNLEFGTSKDNRADAVKHGTMSRRHGRQAVLSEEVVAYIRQLPLGTRGGENTNKALAIRFGVCARLIRAVRNGTRWKPEITEGKKAAFTQVTVVSVETEAPEVTYGLTVEIDHSHVTGGIVTHNTGRLSCKAPAFQTIPKHTKWSKKLRRCYIAPDGYLVVERDYSQGELKVVACIANEQNMIQAYLAGLDLHIKTGGESMGLTYAEMLALKESNLDLFEIYRQRGKPGNFGLLYGMGAAGFKIYAESGYGVKITLEEAEAFRHKFLYESYPGLVEYHKSYKAFAHKHGHVRSPLGRIRHLPLINSTHNKSRSEAERQAVNSPVQGCLSDMLLWTTALEQAQGLTATMPNFGACHDAAYSYVHEDRIDQDIAKGMEIMQNLPFHLVGWAPQLQFTADAKYGKNMGDLQKWKAPA